MTENKQVASNYIINLYNDILALNNLYASYINIRADLCLKMNIIEKDLDNLSKDAMQKLNGIADDDITNYKNLTDNVRFAMARIYLQYKTLTSNKDLKEKVDMKNFKDFETIYKKMRADTRVILDDLEIVCLILNNIIIDEVMGSLFMTSQDFFLKSYGQPQQKSIN
jgi:hypothetical protein